MRYIKIFLASSIVEFETERKEVHDFIQKLEYKLRENKDISLKLIKCENMDDQIVPEGKQTEYDREIISCDLIMFLFGNHAGDFTIHELKVAAENFGNDKDKISVMCSVNPYKSKDSSLKKLADNLEKYRIVHREFSSITEIENEILMKLILLL